LEAPKVIFYKEETQYTGNVQKEQGDVQELRREKLKEGKLVHLSK
jgi:hypothetical protein